MSTSHNHHAPKPLGGLLVTPTTKFLAALVAIAVAILLEALRLILRPEAGARD